MKERKNSDSVGIKSRQRSWIMDGFVVELEGSACGTWWRCPSRPLPRRVNTCQTGNEAHWFYFCLEDGVKLLQVCHCSFVRFEFVFACALQSMGVKCRWHVDTCHYIPRSPRVPLAHGGRILSGTLPLSVRERFDQLAWRSFAAPNLCTSWNGS